MIDLAGLVDETTRVLVIAMDNERGRPMMVLRRPMFPGETIETMLDNNYGHPDVLKVYVCLQVTDRADNKTLCQAEGTNQDETGVR